MNNHSFPHRSWSNGGLPLRNRTEIFSGLFFGLFTFLAGLFRSAHRLFRRIALFSVVLNIVVLCTATLAHAEEDAHPVRVKLVSLHESLDTRDDNSQASTLLALRFEIKPGWHIYWENSGESAIPTRVDWTASNGWKVGAIQWPTPTRFIERGEITTFGYQKQVMLLASLVAEVPEAYADDQVAINARVRWLVCKDVCIPGNQDVALTIPLTATPAALSENAAAMREVEAALPARLINEVQILPSLLHETLAPQAQSTVLFRVKGLNKPNPAADTAEVQLFPGPSERLSLGQPKLSWVGEDLLITAPITTKASTEIGTHTLSGLLAVSPAHHPTATALHWEMELPVAESLGAEREEFKASIAAAGEFSIPEYRLVRWNDQKEDAGSATTAGSSATERSAQSAQASRSFIVILIFAFIGGMILNLMPCVLPIIAIKIMGFVEQKQHSAAGGQGKGGAIPFCAGVLFSFIVLACVVIALRSIGVQLGWGFQFQHPEFVSVIALVVFVLSLGFFDLYVFALPFMQRYCSAVDTLKPSPLKHFFDGIIATILSTPCTAPFLGTALVFAFTQGPLYTLAIHLAIGSGLALPYFILATNPKFLAFLPRPGNWMHRMRQAMGFMLLATVIWLLFVLQKLTGEGVIWCLLLMLSLLFAIWLYDWSKDWSKKVRGIARVGIGLGFLATTLVLFPKATLRVSSVTPTTMQKNGIEWLSYSEANVTAALSANQPVFIDFTADWCITCKANEFLIINTDQVSQAITEYGVVPMIADWTNGDEAITKALTQYGGRGVPLYVVISPDISSAPVVLSTIPSKSALVEAFKAAARR